MTTKKNSSTPSISKTNLKKNSTYPSLGKPVIKKNSVSPSLGNTNIKKKSTSTVKTDPKKNSSSPSMVRTRSKTDLKRKSISPSQGKTTIKKKSTSPPSVVKTTSNTDLKNNSMSPSMGKTRSKTDINNLKVVKEEMSPFVGEKMTSLMEISEATTMMIMSHYGIQDNDIIKTAFMSLVEPENYNRKTSFTKSFGSIKAALKELQPFQMLFTEKNTTKMYSKDNIMALLSNLEKLNMVSNAALQSLILVSAITLTKKKPEGLKMKMPSGSIQGLSKTEIKQRLSYLLTISQVLFHKSHSFDKLDQKKVFKMHKDLIKIVGEY